MATLPEASLLTISSVLTSPGTPGAAIEDAVKGQAGGEVIKQVINSGQNTPTQAHTSLAGCKQEEKQARTGVALQQAGEAPRRRRDLC